VNQTTARNALFTLVAIWLGLVSSVAAAGDGDFEETHEFLQVVIGGKTYHLDSLIVKAQGASGRLPIALITHGTAVSSKENRAENVGKFSSRAHDMAARGWLAVVVIRRGYGQSDGYLPRDNCERPHVKQDLDAPADDLQAVIDVVKRRPDADGSRIIAIGDSSGGGTVVALGARNPPGLVGVVSVSGGVHLVCAGWDDRLVEAYRTYGVTSRVPNLWLYMKNDSYFPPEVVQRMQTAFVAGGGDAKLMEFDPSLDEGHYMFLNGGRAWLGEMDKFLRQHRLPTWNDADVLELLGHLHLSGGHQQFFADYFAAPISKAMAFSPTAKHVYFQVNGDASLAEVRKAAVSRCQSARNNDCIVVMENNRWVGPATQ